MMKTSMKKMRKMLDAAKHRCENLSLQEIAERGLTAEQLEFVLNDEVRDKLIIIMVVIGEPQLSGGIKPEVNTSDNVDVREITATLNWGNLSPGEKLSDAAYKKEKWENSVYCPQPFPDGIPTLIEYKAMMDDLKAKIDAVGKKKATSEQAAAIKKSASKLQTATKTIMTVWQNKMSATPLDAVAIAYDGGFDYTDHGSRGKRKAGLFKTTEAGVLLGSLPGEGYHEWQTTEDEGKTAVFIEATSSGVKILRGLTSQKKYWLRGRKILTKGRYGDWSNWMYENAP